MAADDDEYWRRLLSGDLPALKSFERMFRSLPSPPRCKLCMAPFRGPFAPFLKVLGFRRWSLNSQLCRQCVGGISKKRGGAEVPVSLLFADIRGSTSLAETMSPSAFSELLSRFFGVVTEAVDSEFGVVDHIVGDGVMAMWIPGFVGDDHPWRAVVAGRKAAAQLHSMPAEGITFPAGVGVHTGTAYVGVVGEADSVDFTVVGDAANTTARLGSSAAGGELMLSTAIVEAARVDTTRLERRVLELKGKADAFEAWVEKVPA